MRLKRKKVYLVGQCGGEIVAGDIEDILRVQVEQLMDGTARYFVYATSEQEKILAELELTFEPGPQAEVSIESDEGSTIQDQFDEELATYESAEEPDSFDCPICKKSHERGSPVYYTHLDAFLADDSEEEPEESEDSEEKADVDERTHTLSVGRVRALVAKIDDVAELEQLLAEEKLHPEYGGGRKGAFTCINERIAALQEE